MSMRKKFLGVAAVAVVALLAPAGATAAVAAPRDAGYDRQVMQERPCAYYNAATAGTWTDQVTGAKAEFGRTGHGWTLLGGRKVPVFNGRDQFATLADRACFSIGRSGALTLQAWMKPAATRFARTEQSGYVWWAGKGQRSGPGGDQEWGLRMYSSDNTENRANRISGYVFGRAGGLGAGSQFQDPIKIGQWIHYTFVINWGATSAQYPHGYTRIYRDGVLRQTASIAAYPNVVPFNGGAPVRIGTRNGKSFFAGAVAKFAVYPRELPADRVAEQARALR